MAEYLGATMRAPHVPLALAAAGILALAACGDDTTTSSSDKDAAAPVAATPAAPAPATYHVGVDGNTADNPLGKTINSIRYFPKALQVHPGDTVVFDLQDSGDPHTVALGTYVDKAAAAVAALPSAAPQDAPPPPEVQALPHLFPEGPGDAIQAAAQPCYQATGAPPLQDACEVQDGDEWKGTESLVNSGWMAADEPFTVKISESMSPGTYTFLCLLHGTDMSGTVTVVDKGTTIPSPEEVAATAQQELEAELAALEPADTVLGTATDTKPMAGALSPKTTDSYIAAFAPENIKIPVGGTVTWTLQGVHTISLEAPADAQALRVPAPDGAVHQNPKVPMPAGGPGFAGPQVSVVDGGSYSGGFRNSGIGFGFPPKFATFSLTFPKAGTFNYLCGIHTGMKGTVTVG